LQADTCLQCKLSLPFPVSLFPEDYFLKSKRSCLFLEASLCSWTSTTTMRSCTLVAITEGLRDFREIDFALKRNVCDLSLLSLRISTGYQATLSIPLSFPRPVVWLRRCLLGPLVVSSMSFPPCSNVTRLRCFFSGTRVQSLPEQLQRCAALGRFKLVGDSFSSMISEPTQCSDYRDNLDAWNCSVVESKIITLWDFELFPLSYRFEAFEGELSFFFISSDSV